MASRILVTGGTGTLGRIVVPLLREADREVRCSAGAAASPAPVLVADAGVEYVTGDLAKDEGIDSAVGRGRGRPAPRGRTQGRRRGDPEPDAGGVEGRGAAPVYISVIGADKLPLGWFKSKLGAEQAVAGSGIPWTTLRAAQFHDLILKAVRTMGKAAGRARSRRTALPAGRRPRRGGPGSWS